MGGVLNVHDVHEDLADGEHHLADEDVRVPNRAEDDVELCTRAAKALGSCRCARGRRRRSRLGVPKGGDGAQDLWRCARGR